MTLILLGFLFCFWVGKGVFNSGEKVFKVLKKILLEG
jgi:hypothetical protein